MSSGIIKQILKQHVKNKNMYISYFLRITETVQRTQLFMQPATWTHLNFVNGFCEYNTLLSCLGLSLTVLTNTLKIFDACVLVYALSI